ncbi:MAG: transcription termination/antitermination protein NusA [Candidatus Moranbacteria bacterium]|nr:transcription termination/antitermination protein NusA [Candidatus Moranbacteria bacterium]
MAARKKAAEPEQSLSGRLGEFGSAIMQIVDEKGLPKGKVLEVVEAALAVAYKRDYGKKSQVIRAQFDEVAKTASFFLVKEVVDETTREFVEETEEAEEETIDPKADAPEAEVTEEIEEDRLPRYNPERDLTLPDAKLLKKDAKVGDIIDIELPPHEDFGRVAAQTAKQVVIQRLREAERQVMFEEYKDHEGEVVNGIVQRVEGRNVYVDLGKSVGILFPSEQVEGENYRIGQHLKVYLVRVEAESKGPGLVLSRSHPDMIRHLFSLEVPEISAGTVEIKAIAREAGSRTKIAVSANQEGVDPIGSCVGQRGTRVQAVIDELGGEKVDIIEWNENPAKFIIAAMSPAKVVSVDISEDEAEGCRAKVVVPDDQLSLAIGKRGQNVRLAAKLAGCRIDVSGAGVPAATEEKGEIAETENETPASEAEETSEAAE